MEIKNKECVRVMWVNHRARKMGDGDRLPSDILSKLFSLQRGKCSICKMSLGIEGSHLDHVVPFSRGGRNINSNVQLTCPTCNQKKGGKDPTQFMQEMGFLL